MNNLLALIFDGSLAVLLIVTIGYCRGLSRRIRTLQDTRGELASMIAQFDQATGRAISTMADLQAVSKRIADALQLKIEKANFLADDLAFLIEKSSKLSVQLESQAKGLKPEPAKLRGLADAPPPVMKPKLASWQPAKADIPSSVKSAESLEALLTRLAAANTQPAAAPRPERPASPRTDAERELLEALKSGQ